MPNQITGVCLLCFHGLLLFTCADNTPYDPDPYIPNRQFLRAFITFVTFFLLLSTKPSPSPEGPIQNAQIELWATFLGVTSAALAAIQYCPQLLHTYRLKLVGALSIPMMIIQSPGAGLMVISIALR